MGSVTTGRFGTPNSLVLVSSSRCRSASLSIGYTMAILQTDGCWRDASSRQWDACRPTCGRFVVAAPAAPPRSGSSGAPGGGRRPRLRRQLHPAQVLLAAAGISPTRALPPPWRPSTPRRWAHLRLAGAPVRRRMRGHYGDGQSAAGSGFLGWSMVHRAARPVAGQPVGDPHWPVHVTLANMTRGADGRWSTVAGRSSTVAADERDLMRPAPAVDKLTQALVRNALHRRYGVSFARNACTGRVGVPDQALRAFAKRGASIEALLADLGFDPGRRPGRCSGWPSSAPGGRGRRGRGPRRRLGPGGDRAAGARRRRAGRRGRRGRAKGS